MSTRTDTHVATEAVGDRTEQPGAPAGERAWLLVARREVVTKLTDKSFVIGTLITIGMIVAFLGWQIANEGKTETYTVAATAESSATAELLAERVPKVDDAIRVEVTEVESDGAGVSALEDDQADVLLRPGDDGWTLVGTDEVPDDLSRASETVVREAALASNAEQAGTSVAALEQDSALGTTLLEGDAERQGFAKAMGFALAFLFYMAALGFGYTLSGSVVEEKANRIVEIITTKIPVRQLLIGKIAGNTLLAVGQTALLVSIGLVGVSFTEFSKYLPALTQGVGWFVAFFLVGFCFIACWWAVAGALASRAEDLQTTATPLNFLMMGVFLGSFLFDGTALTVASYVPPFSCVLMPIRVLQGDAAMWEPFAAIAILVAAMGATVLLAERLYRRALLQTQGRVTLKQAWRATE
ncbi:MAG TPA: ABC transporter permease [Nocardioidaceae bacterium]|nr:ABC transporter permease [Nocardioidaceae bacterium]